MFTGIINNIGRVRSVEETGGDRTFWIDTGDGYLDDVSLGDSIAVSGVCLTVTAMDGGVFAADVSRETLALTTLSRLGQGGRVNLEKSLAAGERLGGHLVTGHVDDMGALVSRSEDARSWRMVFRATPTLSRLIATKGSIAVDGVSLTVNGVSGIEFDVNLIPHTLEMTTLGALAAGDPVNLEVDIMARYAARWQETAGAGQENKE
ncbi:MAG: riboflavin synthase [Xanthomonadales bacterium]|nr:riboflavin synthase [Xanthomonadales bacterium]